METEKRQLMTDDDELGSKSRRDDYRRQRILKDVLTYVICAGIVCVALVVLYFICFNANVRMQAISQILNNLPVIVLAIFAILGIRNIRQ